MFTKKIKKIISLGIVSLMLSLPFSSFANAAYGSGSYSVSGTSGIFYTSTFSDTDGNATLKITPTQYSSGDILTVTLQYWDSSANVYQSAAVKSMFGDYTNTASFKGGKSGTYRFCITHGSSNTDAGYYNISD